MLPVFDIRTSARANDSAPAAYVVHDAEGVAIECFPVWTDEDVLHALLSEIYQRYWDGIQFGTLVQGAVWEIAVDRAPEHVRLLDGYLTVDFGLWHFHVCIGEHRGTKGRPVPPALAQLRRTSRAEFFRRLKADGSPTSWGFQMFNGADEIQMTVFFPNPYLDRTGKIKREPDWAQLAMWDDLRLRYAGLEPDPLDRSSSGFVH